MTGGARNATYLARRGAERLVVRVSRRHTASLEWELDLLDALTASGLAVPCAVPTDDGRRHDRGVLVQRFIVGTPPRDRRDWMRVVETLAAAHDAAAGRQQRPGVASAGDLLRTVRGGDVRLDVVPADAVALVRAAWRPLVSGEQVAIHGDLGARNVLMTDRGVTIIDWDEAGVDVPALDYADVPWEVSSPVGPDREALYAAGIAWEVATCWVAEPDYAAGRLEELHTLMHG